MKLRVKCVPTAEALRAERDARNLTQSEAATQVGVAARTWQNWESGAVTPRAKHRRVLIEWLEREQAGV